MAEYVCPHCKKPIYDDDALLCLYCGDSLRRSSGVISRLKYPRPRIIATAVILLVLAGFWFLIMK